MRPLLLEVGHCSDSYRRWCPLGCFVIFALMAYGQLHTPSCVVFREVLQSAISRLSTPLPNKLLQAVPADVLV